MLDIDTAWRFAAALGLGMLIGMERQRTQAGDEPTFAGVRTFALLAVLGASAGHLGQQTGQPWFVLAVLLVTGALVIAAYVASSRQGDLGMTTEVSALLTVVIGVMCSAGLLGVAAAVGVACMLMLALKEWLHGIARRIESADVEATLKFAIITLLVLPLLPNQNYGPDGLEFFNPYKTWLMVVLIAGLNFAGYILVKVLGREHGLALTGLLGGLVSSTAVTLSFSQRSRETPELGRVLALAVLLAWTLMFFRVVVTVGIVEPALAGRLVVGMGIMGGASVLACLVLWRRGRSADRAEVVSAPNPFELGEAVKFGALFGVVLFVARAAQVWFGDTGLYLAGALAGLTDVDAIALSMANLANQDPASLGPAARTVVIAVVANTLVKSGMVLWIADAAMRRAMVPVIALLAVAGVVGAAVVG